MELQCIRCGEDAVIRLDLNDGDTMSCSECEKEFTVSDVEEVLACWGAILPWIKSHPARKGE